LIPAKVNTEQKLAVSTRLLKLKLQVNYALQKKRLC